MSKWKPAGKPPKIPGPEHRVEADWLRRRFQNGDMLAPFECCATWEHAGLDSKTLPDWVVKRLAEIAAAYYRTTPFAQHDPDEPGKITPRRLIEMAPKDRKKVIPSLDKIAGLSGVQGRPNAWLWRAEHGRDEYVTAYLDKLERQAKDGQNIWVIPAGKRTGETMPILDPNGRLRDAVRDEVGRLFRVGGYGGESWNKARTVRRRVKSSKRRPDK